MPNAKVIATVRYVDPGTSKALNKPAPVVATFDGMDSKMPVTMTALLHWLHSHSIPFSVTYRKVEE